MFAILVLLPSHKLIVLTLAALALSSSAQLIGNIIPAPAEPAPSANAANISYKYGFAAQDWFQYPGGLYKAASTTEFPASTSMSGGLFKLNKGGMREMHWHNPNEWAFVMNGTCRATLVNQGSTHMVESWDFDTGDIWFFPGNFPHVILGVGNDDYEGCTYLSAYDQGDFDERLDAQGLSAWFTQAPAPIAAQAFGIANVSMITANLKNHTNNFMPQGNLTELTAGDTTPSPVLAATSAPLMAQVNSNTHRYAFGTAGYLEVHTDGGTVRTADSQYFGASTAMSGSLVHFEPGALRQMHWHANEDEWQFVLNGTVEIQLYNGLGALSGVNTLGPNDLGFAPKGIGHFIKNPDPVNEAWMVLVFNNGSFTNVEIEDWVGNYPLAYTALSLNTSMEFVEQFNYSRTGMLGSGPGHDPDTVYTI